VFSDDVANGIYMGCGDRHSYQSIATADGDGDGRMDYMPASAYSRHFRKYYGWLPPLLDLAVSE